MTNSIGGGAYWNKVYQEMAMWSWKRLCRATWLFTNALVLIAVPYLAVAMRRKHYEPHAIAWFIAGVFVLLALPITVFGIAQHLEHYTKPSEQKKIIRVLMMVPIYAIDSWLALRFKDLAIYIDTLRECYEAYVIHSFFEFCVAYLGDEANLALLLLQKPQTEHIFPFNFFPPWKMGEDFVKKCKAGVHNYVVVRPLTTLVALFCEWGGVYGEGLLDPHKAYMYLSAINNVSQVWALYCLVLFYKATNAELKPIQPFAKFACVKSVVFFSFWQSVAIAILVKAGFITQEDSLSDYDVDDVAAGIQDLLICIEMFFAAVAHAYAFSAKEYVDPSAAKQPLLQSLRDMFDVSDLTTVMYDRVNLTTGKVIECAGALRVDPFSIVSSIASPMVKKPEVLMLKIASENKHHTSQTGDCSTLECGAFPG